MKIKSSILSLSLVASSVASVGALAQFSAPVLKEEVQKVINDYYQKYSKQEQFTAVAASVLIPHDEQVDIGDIVSAVTGTMGIPPATQPITTDNLFDIGSITKSFTSMIILQLQTENKLGLEDTVGKWLPQYKQWKDVTIRQLLNMTSGIPNYSEDPAFDKKLTTDPTHVWTDEELISYAHPEKPIKKNPKNRYEYCNTNYILAGMIIEKVTNDTFENQLQKRILSQKNYFKDSFYLAGPNGVATEKEVMNRRVHGYYYDEKTKKLIDTINNDLSWAGAAGALVANTEDVVKWVQVLYHGVLINPRYKERILAELESAVSTKTGLPIIKVTADDPMGFGLGVAVHYDKDTGNTFWTYEGSTLGFRVMYLWSACNDVTTVVALNSKGGEGNPNSKMGDHIVDANMNLYKTVMKQYPQLTCEF